MFIIIHTVALKKSLYNIGTLGPKYILFATWTLREVGAGQGLGLGFRKPTQGLPVKTRSPSLACV